LVMTARSTASRAGGRYLRPLGYERTGHSLARRVSSYTCISEAFCRLPRSNRLACSRSRLFAPLSPRPVPKTVPKKPTPRDPPAPAMDSVHSPARTEVTPFAFTTVARRCVPRRPPDPSASRWRWARVSSGLPGFYFTTVDAAVQRSSSACPVRPSAAAASASVLNVSIFATARRVLRRVAWS
jgi:hypothetical protein